MSEHTQWKVGKWQGHPIFSYSIRDVDDKTIAIVHSEKDARLIAAAPDLYDALNHLKYWLFDGEKLHKIDDKILKEVIKEVNGAIAKAEKRND